MKISFVIPVYNNELSLIQTVDQIEGIFKAKNIKDKYEVIFIDDGSKDNSFKILLSLKKKNKFLKIIKLKRNFGQRVAVDAGFEEADGNAIILLNADLQDPISLVPKMITKWKNGAELVICTRAGTDENILYKILAKIANSLIKLSVPNMPIGGFDFLLIDKKIVDYYNKMDTKYKYFKGEMLTSGALCAFIPYKRKKRPYGRSQYTFLSKLSIFFTIFLNFTSVPLRLIFITGLIYTIVGISYTFSMYFAWLNNRKR